MNYPELESVPFFHALGLFALPFLGLILIWIFAIKGIALWKAARNGHKGWFIALLLINSIGILELIYILWVSKKYVHEEEQVSATTE